MKKNYFNLSLVFVFILFFAMAGQAKADEAVTVHLEIETAGATLFNGSISVSACPESPGSATTTINGFCAFAAAGIDVEADWGQYGAFITSIGGASQGIEAGLYWTWFTDLNLGQTGINQHPLVADEHLLFTLGTNPLKISASDFLPFDGATTTISALQFDQAAYDWIPASDATVDFGWGTTTTDANGQAVVAATSSAPFSVSATKTNFLPSNSINITPQAAQARITIRNGATVVFSGLVNLSASNASSMDIAPTAGGNAVAVPARSLLSVLEMLDAEKNEFAITDLQYYSYFDPPSFYIKCMTIAEEADPLCNLWQYNLNGVYPSDSVNQVLLKNGDIIFLYFGNQRQVSLSAASADTGASLTATAQKYDPDNNAYVATTGVTIGVTQPNPDDPWNPLEIATSTVDANGQAIFSLNVAGVYNVGIKEDYYSPVTTLTVTAPAPASNGSIIIQNSGGGLPALPLAAKVDLNKAIDFLISKQSADGSFGSALITDWAAIALASANPNGAAGQKVKSYLLADANPLVGLNPVSDYARRAMALMSLNISPYDGVRTNYIKKITDLFDGRQFGDTSLYNDDIFALLVLNKAGYAVDDEMIKQTVNYIISKQQADGSWGGADLTAAAVQALEPVSSLNGVTAVLTNARNFLAKAQNADGGYGNSYTTSWVIQAIAALGEAPGDWKKNNNTPENYLALNQGADGGLEKNDDYETNRVWSTAYAVPAVQGKSWASIMSSFVKAEDRAAPANLNLPENPVATSTLERLDVATTTPEVLIEATSTPELIQIKSEKEKVNTDETVKSDIALAAAKGAAPKVLGAKIFPEKPKKALVVRAEKKSEPAAIQAAPVKTSPDSPAPAAGPSAVKENFLVLTGRLIYRGLRYVLNLLRL